MSEVDNKEVRAPETDGFVTFKITLKNVDLNSGRPLEGAKFKVTGRHEQWYQVTCDSFGQAEITISDEASWKFEQTEAPSGHKLIPNPIVINVTTSSFEVVGDQESDWYDYDNSTSTLTVKNSPEPDPQPEKPDPQPADTIELFLKNTNEEGDLLRGAEFKLINPNAEERIINWDNIPLGSFPILRLNMQGEWKLEQTKAPLGYQFIPAPLLIRFAAAKVMVDGDETSDWFDFNSASRTLTIKNTPEPTKYVTNNSLAELIRLVKAQSSKVLNVTVNHTIDTYTPMEPQTAKKKFYADIPCTQSKTTMNVQISPNDSAENVGLLTYAEPMDGKVRVYFSEQPTEPYVIDSVELTPVTSVISEHLIKRVSDIPINEKLKFSSGKTFILSAKNVTGHEPNSVTFASEYIIENTEWGEALSYSESNIHKTIMPKYYNELSELEKKAIVLHRFEVGALNEDLSLNGELVYIKDQVESYFYAPDIGEIGVYVIGMLSNGDGEIRYYGIYSDQGRDLGVLTQKKTFENGTLGGYFTTTMRKNDFLADVVLVSKTGGDIGSETDLYYIHDSPQYSTVTSGIVPFCDIKGDTLVMKDTDGYWKIVE